MSIYHLCTEVNNEIIPSFMFAYLLLSGHSNLTCYVLLIFKNEIGADRL